MRRYLTLAAALALYGAPASADVTIAFQGIATPLPFSYAAATDPPVSATITFADAQPFTLALASQQFAPGASIDFGSLLAFSFASPIQGALIDVTLADFTAPCGFSACVYVFPEWRIDLQFDGSTLAGALWFIDRFDESDFQEFQIASDGPTTGSMGCDCTSSRYAIAGIWQPVAEPSTLALLLTPLLLTGLRLAENRP